MLTEWNWPITTNLCFWSLTAKNVVASPISLHEPDLELFHLTLIMTFANVFKMSVTSMDNSPSQDYSRSDDLITWSTGLHETLRKLYLSELITELIRSSSLLYKVVHFRTFERNPILPGFAIPCLVILKKSNIIFSAVQTKMKIFRFTHL